MSTPPADRSRSGADANSRRGAKVIDPFRIAVSRLFSLDAPVVAAGLAFYGVLSVFPSIALVISCYGLFATTDEILLLAESLADLLPRDAHAIVHDELTLLSKWSPHHISPFIVLSLAIVVWSTMSGWKALITGIRLVTNENAHMSIVGYQFRTLLISFLVIGGIVIAAMSFISIARIIGIAEVEALELRNDTGPKLTFKGQWLVWSIASVGVYTCLLIIYRITMTRATASLADCSRGAAAGALCWFIAITAFDLYAEAATRRSMYGALTGTIALLLWFYISSYAALFGAAFAAALTTARSTAAAPASLPAQIG